MAPPTKDTTPTLSVQDIRQDSTTILSVPDPAAATVHEFTLGRAARCHVRFVDPWISGHHATIRAEPMVGPNSVDEEGHPRWLWLIRDAGSTNGLFHSGIQVGGKGYPSPWMVIEEGDSYYLSRSQVKFSFSGYFTKTGDTDPGEDEKPVVTDGPEVKPDAKDSAQIKSVWDLALLILTGPRDTANWIWWSFLAIVASAVALGIEWIKSR